MKILAGFPNATSARARSAAYYAPYKHATTTTLYLFGWIQNQTTGEWALQVPEDYELHVPANDRANLEPDTWEKPGP